LPDLLTAAATSLASAAFEADGFSDKTCLPAANALIFQGPWPPLCNAL